MSEFKSFEEFWPHYLREHSRPETRALHIAGTTIAAGSLAAFLATGHQQVPRARVAGLRTRVAGSLPV